VLGGRFARRIFNKGADNGHSVAPRLKASRAREKDNSTIAARSSPAKFHTFHTLTRAGKAFGYFFKFEEISSTSYARGKGSYSPCGRVGAGRHAARRAESFRPASRQVAMSGGAWARRVRYIDRG